MEKPDTITFAEIFERYPGLKIAESITFQYYPSVSVNGGLEATPLAILSGFHRDFTSGADADRQQC